MPLQHAKHRDQVTVHVVDDFGMRLEGAPQEDAALPQERLDIEPVRDERIRSTMRSAR